MRSIGDGRAKNSGSKGEPTSQYCRCASSVGCDAVPNSDVSSSCPSVLAQCSLSPHAAAALARQLSASPPAAAAAPHTAVPCAVSRHSVRAHPCPAAAITPAAAGLPIPTLCLEPCSASCRRRAFRVNTRDAQIKSSVRSSDHAAVSQTISCAPTLLERRVEAHLAWVLLPELEAATGPGRALTQFSVCSRFSAGRRPDVIGCRRSPPPLPAHRVSPRAPP